MCRIRVMHPATARHNPALVALVRTATVALVGFSAFSHVGCGSGASGGGGGSGLWLPTGDAGAGGQTDAASTATDGAGSQADGTGADDGTTAADGGHAGTGDGLSALDALPGETTGGGTNVCAPGATQLCYCTATAQGVQICAANGKQWQPCQCESEPDAGAGADAAAGADGGAATDGGATTDAGVADDCADRAKQVYALGDDSTLLRFFPDQLKFEIVGKVNCSQPGGGTPFSMAVDRQATAWVLYQKGLGGGGGLFQVSTKDANCTSTKYTSGQQGFELFGMGFSANSKGSQDETLFIAGGSALSWNITNGKLGSIALPSLSVAYQGTIDVGGGSPELTGDGDGKLWGFFPQSSPPSVREINKLTGKTGKTFPLPASAMKSVQAWAFARWGGSFYLFFKSQSDPSSAVFRIDAAGAVTKVIPTTGYNIVGAGVSSCAPTGPALSAP